MKQSEFVVDLIQQHCTEKERDVIMDEAMGLFELVTQKYKHPLTLALFGTLLGEYMQDMDK